jgi:hypothetical protein
MLISALMLDSAKLAGIVGDGDSLTTTQSADFLIYLNQMVDTWNATGLLVPYKVTENFTWASGNASRTIGPTGNLVTTRPVEIQGAYIRVSGVDCPLDVLGWSDYQAITDKARTGKPEKIAYQETATNGTIYAYPVPDISYSIYITRDNITAAFATSDDYLPQPGWLEAVRLNLACRIADFTGMPIGIGVRNLAVNSLEVIRRRAHDLSSAPTQTGIMQGSRGGYNIDRGY